MFGECGAHVEFDASHLHRWEKFSIGKLRQTFGLAANAGELFDVVVPRGYVRIADWPIDSNAVAKIRFKIQIAPAIALPAPHDGFAADLSPANPTEFRAGCVGVGIVLVVDEKFMGVLVASVIALALDVLRI